jgi:hypothetical protein
VFLLVFVRFHCGFVASYSEALLSGLLIPSMSPYSHNLTHNRNSLSDNQKPGLLPIPIIPLHRCATLKSWLGKITSFNNCSNLFCTISVCANSVFSSSKFNLRLKVYDYLYFKIIVASIQMKSSLDVQVFNWLSH